MTSHGRKYKTYHCPNHKKGTCPTKSIDEERLNKFVVKAIIKETLVGKSVQELNNLIFTNQYKGGIREKKKELECKLSNLATAIEFNASENLLKQYKKHEETLKLINKKIECGEYVIEIKDTQKKAFLKDVANYIKSSESVDVRLFLHSVIKEILVSNDDVELSLNVA